MNTQITPAARIRARILAHLAAGKDIREAFNAVCGEGAYERLAREVYTTLRARAAA